MNHQRLMIVLVTVLFSVSVLFPAGAAYFSVLSSEHYTRTYISHECQALKLLSGIPESKPAAGAKPVAVETWELHVDLVHWSQADHC